MKSKVRIILSVFILVLGFTAVWAQKGRGGQYDPAQRAEKQTAMMTEKLSLTPEQAAQVKDINLKYAEKQKAMKDETAGEREKHKAALQQLRQEQQAEINKVLNEDQQTQWEKLQAERKEQRGQGRRAGLNGDPEKQAEKMTQRMTENLSLTPEQAAKVKDINLDFSKKMQALRGEKQDGAKPDKDAIKSLRDEHQAALKNVLTKEQFEKWGQMNKERKHDRKGKGKGNMKGQDKGM